MIVKIAGLDCALKNLGIAKVKYDLQNKLIVPYHISLIQTEKSTNKQVRVSSDDFSRATVLAKSLKEIETEVDFWIGEIPSGSQNARANTSFGIAIGVMASLNKSFIQVSPSEVKMAVIGRKTAPKHEMIDWAMKTYPALDWKTKRVKGVTTPVNENEHMADALAVIHAGVETPEFKNAVSMYRKFTSSYSGGI